MSDPEPILLKQWLMINAALNDKSLSKGDVSVQWQILNRYNVKNGYCWPSLKRLAADTGLTQRTIQRSVTRLIESGHSVIVKHGNRVSSNHYRPDFSLFDRVETPTSLPSNEVETAKTVCRDSQVPKVETPTSLKPINEPEHKARDSLRGLDDKSSSDAALASPLTGLPLASKEKYKYPAFWNVYPTRKNVSKTEDEITIKLKDGVLLADIVEGARLYAAYIQIKRATWKGDKDYTKHPQNFVTGSHWLDDWSITPKADVKPKEIEAKPKAKAEVKPKAAPVKAKRKRHQPLDANNPFKNDYDAYYQKSWEHMGNYDCMGCKKRGKIKNQQFAKENFCDVGLALFNKERELSKKYNQWNDDNREAWLKEREA